MVSDSKYHIETVTCEKADCSTTFSVVVNSIYTAVTSPIEELQTKGVPGFTIVDKDGEVDDYVVVNCQCGLGHRQRVYLKKKDERS